MPRDLERLRSSCAKPLDHPDLAAMQAAATQTADFVLRDFASLPESPLGRTATRPEMEAILREPAPEEGRGFAEVVEEVRAKIAPNTLRPTHPRFTAFIPGAPSFISILGDWLCSGLNIFAGVWKEAPAATFVEILVLDWFKDFLGYPAEARGILTGGGSEANLTAMVVARERLDWPKRGRAVAYLSEQRHWSIDRGARIMGLRPEQLRNSHG